MKISIWKFDNKVNTRYQNFATVKWSLNSCFGWQCTVKPQTIDLNKVKPSLVIQNLSLLSLKLNIP